MQFTCSFLLSMWIRTSKLKDIDFEVKAFPFQWVDGKIKIRGGRDELGSPVSSCFYMDIKRYHFCL